MVNQQNYDDLDRRLFGRPGTGGTGDGGTGSNGTGSNGTGGSRDSDAGGSGRTGRAGRDWVEVVDDGSGEAPAAGTALEAAPGGMRDGADGSSRPFNPYFCAAWAVTALMLLGGLLWFTGVTIPDQNIMMANDGSQISTAAMITGNLQLIGIILLPFGLVCAFTLLAIHAVAYRSADRR